MPEMNDSHMDADFSQSLAFEDEEKNEKLSEKSENKNEIVEIGDSDETNSDIDDDAFQTLVGDDDDKIARV